MTSTVIFNIIYDSLKNLTSNNQGKLNMNIDKNKIVEDSINRLHKALYTAWFIVFILMFATIGMHYIVYDIFKRSEDFYFYYGDLKYIFLSLSFWLLLYAYM